MTDKKSMEEFSLTVEGERVPAHGLATESFRSGSAENVAALTSIPDLLARRMADPLSTASGIIAILQLTSTIVGYLNEVKGAAEDRRKVLDEVSNATGLLYMLKDTVEQAQQDHRPFAALATLSAPNGPLEQFNSALEQLASRLAPAHGVRRVGKALSWPFSKSEINAILERMERQKLIFAIALENDHIRLTQALKNSVSQVHAGLQSVSGDVHGLLRANADNESQKILDWLSPINAWSKHNDVSEKRQPGTGQWILETPELREWLNGANKTLWCSGAPGAGKTVLASFIIDHLQQTLMRQDIGLAYVYCSYQDTDQSALNLIASVVQQLTGQLQTMPRGILELYKQHSSRRTRPRLAEMSEKLHSLVKEYSKVFIIVDALDECPESTGARYGFVKALKALPRMVHLLVTSRPISSIGSELDPCVCLQVSARDTDLCLYLENQLQEERRLRAHIAADPTLKDAIISSITEKAQGMFLLARLHITLLAKKLSRKDVLATLHVLPLELNKTYEEAVQRIHEQAEEDAGLANRIILWVLRAFRPMKVAELQHALAVVPGESRLEESAVIDQDLLLSVCAGLVTVEKETDNVGLVHYTAKQYFDSAQPVGLSDAHIHMTTICLTYLLFDDFAKGLDGSEEQLVNEMKAFPFISYAAGYWGFHFEEAHDNEVRLLAESLLLDKNKLASACRYMYSWERNERITRFNGLHVVAIFRSTELAEMLLRAHDVDINLQNDVGQTPLGIACKRGALGLVERFLAVENVDLNAGRDTIRGTALHSAAAFGDPDLVQTLLDRGADIHAITNRLHTALHVAAESGHVRTVELLLEAGCDVEAKTHTGTTPLYRSIRSGNIDVLQTILQHDQNVNVSTWDCWTPLHEAAECNQIAMAQCLLSHGADPSLRTADGQTAFDIAKMLGMSTIADLLSVAQLDQESKHCANLIVLPRIRESVPEDACVSQDPGISSHGNGLIQCFSDQTIGSLARGNDDISHSSEVSASHGRTSANPTTLNDSCDQPAGLKAFVAGDEGPDTAIPTDHIKDTCEAFRFELAYQFPRLDSKLVSRFAICQSTSFSRVSYLRQEHARRVSDQDCKAGQLCVGSCGVPILSSVFVVDSKRAVGGEMDGPELVSPHKATLADQGTDTFPSNTDIPEKFECPLCFEVVKVSKNLPWIHHIHEDLRSFACIELNCSTLAPFGTCRDWIRHDINQHQPLVTWKCDIEDCRYVSMGENHLTEHHRKTHSIQRNFASDLFEHCQIERAEVTRSRDQAPRSREEDQKHVKPLTCVFCGLVCSRYADYYSHTVEHQKQIGLSTLKHIVEVASGMVWPPLSST